MSAAIQTLLRASSSGDSPLTGQSCRKIFARIAARSGSLPSPAPASAGRRQITLPSHPGEACVAITIRSSGQGIPAATGPRIFAPSSAPGRSAAAAAARSPTWKPGVSHD